MATRTNTVEYSFATITATSTAGVAQSFTSISVGPFEVDSPTFVSCILEFTTRDTVTTATSPLSATFGITIGAAAISNTTVTDTIGNTGEQMSFIFTRDVTSYFTTNWSAQQVSGAATVSCALTVATSTVNNSTAKLIITYTYDDAASGALTRRIKTVRLPYDSPANNLTNSLVNLGGTMPALDSILPEASKTYRDIWFEVSANEAAAAVTDYNFAYSIDGGGEVQSGLIEQGLNSATWMRYIIKTGAAGWPPGSTHTLALRTTVTGRWNTPTVLLCVTYSYDETASTQVINSVMYEMETVGPIGGATNTLYSRFEVPVYVPEPGTPSLGPSGVRFSFNINADVGGLNARVGSQAFRAYTHTAGSLSCGMYEFCQRFDSNGVQGSGFTIARGVTTLTIDVYRTDTTDLGSNLSGIVYLNYITNIATAGSAAHTHTLVANVAQYAADVAQLDSTFSFAIPETNYWLSGYGFEIIQNRTQNVDGNVVLVALRQSSEGSGFGWVDLYADAARGAGERGITITWCRARDTFRRWPSDTNGSRMDIETSRTYRLFSTSATYWMMKALVTYHALTWSTTRVVRDFGVPVNGASVTIHAAADYGTFNQGELLATATTNVSGQYTFDWYDNVQTVFGRCTHAGKTGASDTFTVGT